MGKIVLRQYKFTNQESKNKLSLKWKGPSMVPKIVTPGSNYLENLKCLKLPRAFNESIYINFMHNALIKFAY